MKCEPFVMRSIEIWAFHTSKFIIGPINNVAWWLYLTFVFPCFLFWLYFYQLLLLPAYQISGISLSAANTVFHSKATFFYYYLFPFELIVKYFTCSFSVHSLWWDIQRNSFVTLILSSWTRNQWKMLYFWYYTINLLSFMTALAYTTCVQKIFSSWNSTRSEVRFTRQICIISANIKSFIL